MMHEWALAESVVLTVIGEAEKKGLNKVLKVDIKIGELQQIEHDMFMMAMEDNVKLYNLDFKINIEISNSILQCKRCGMEWVLSQAMEGLAEDEREAIHFIPEMSHIFIRCPRCGSPDFEIVKGRGVWIDSIEGEK